MNTLHRTHGLLLGLGMTSLVLGVIALLLAFLPVLGAPLSALGLLSGLVGTAAVFFGGGNLRWCLGGVATCCLALGVNLAIYCAPGGYLPERRSPQLWRQGSDEAVAPPPAAPHWFD